MKTILSMIVILICLVSPSAEATISSSYLKKSDEWFKSEEGRRIADHILTWQSSYGSWPKNKDTAKEPYKGDTKKISGTFDNGATTGELRFLAKSFRMTGEPRYEQAFLKGLDHILIAQYPTGGWPQFYPLRKGYYRHITFNDNSMVRILLFLRDVNKESDFSFLTDKYRATAKSAFDKGIQCILDCQIIVNGKRTVWCAQHDEVDLRPRPARSYELESLSGGESVAILRLLMSLDNPSAEVKRAIQAGIEWYESAKITGIRLEKQDGDRVAIEDPTAPTRWARFYEIETNRPFFCDRDGIKKYNYNDIKAERRNGYSWYGEYATALLEKEYPAWRDKHLLKATNSSSVDSVQRPRVIVTSDGEIDDECSMVRFLLYANEWDIEGIITSSSQYHWHGHNWAGDDWIQPYLHAYQKIYPNLVKHDSRFPTPQYLQERTFLGNVKSEGEMEEITPGSQHIVKVLLDESDDTPIWLQAWGGPNTIARALKTIEEKYPEKMPYVASKMRFFFIWEQDSTYQDYIQPSWGKYNIPTIISDQFVAIAYSWKKIIPKNQHAFFNGDWMKKHILEGHGPLCSLYKSHKNGDFRSEGDSPAFLHTIVNGLRSLESPGWGGWGGRYTKVRENIWLDPVLEPGYTYPEGRWYSGSAWGRQRMRLNKENDEELMAYLKPMWRWSEALQHDFASRADWCVKSFEEANHPPVVKLAHANDLQARPGSKVKLSARGTDPDGDLLTYRWWHYPEAGTFDGTIDIQDDNKQDASFTLPSNAKKGQHVHIICEVTDNGAPSLTRYQRVVVEVE
jgi:PelA/Pel-15E family pectate lyase